MKRLIVALMLVGGLFVSPVMAKGPVFYLAKADEWKADQHLAEMRDLGIKGATVYYNVTQSFKWVAEKYLATNHPLVLVPIIKDGKGSGLLTRVTEGAFDTDLRKLATAIKESGRHIIVRPFHEIDGNWYQWGMYAKGNSPQLAVEAIIHVVKLFREVGAKNASFEINFNRRDGIGKVLTEAEYLLSRLDEWVDAYSVSTYNRCGSSAKYSKERSFADDFAPIYDRLAVLTDKPIRVAETSTTGLCTDGVKLPWFEAMLNDLTNRFSRVDMVTFYFGQVTKGVASNEVAIDWGVGEVERSAFRQLLEEFVDDATVVPEVTTAPRTLDLSPSREGSASGRWSAPWSIWARMDWYQQEADNPERNPVTREPFGSTERLLRLQLKQGLLYELRKGVRIGPTLSFGYVDSPNQDQWWNNEVIYGADLSVYFDLPRNIFDWGTLQLGVAYEHIEFTAPTPDRFGGDDDRIMLRMQINGGGDWFR